MKKMFETVVERMKASKDVAELINKEYKLFDM